jgi:hypothetical protein
MESKAANSVAPSGDGTSNTAILGFTFDTTARNAELPAYLYGQFIRVTPVGANAWWYISNSASAAVDRNALVGITGGAAATRGSYLANGSTVERICPYAAQGSKLYLVWQGDAAGTLFQIEKGSGKPYSVTADT